MRKKKPEYDAQSPILTGAKSLQDRPWARVKVDGLKVYFPMAEAVRQRGKGAVQDRLANAGMLIYPSAFKELWDEIVTLKDFPKRNLLEQRGWEPPCFGLPSGKAIAPTGQKAVALYEGSSGCESSGTLKGWKAVAKLVTGQHLAIFLIMIAFVAPILKLSRRVGNFGFELVGDAGKGKSTLLYLVASVVGKAVGEAPYYWHTCNTTVLALEEKAREHSDLPLLLDDATTFAGSESATAKAGSFKQFILSLSHAETKHRFQGGRQRSFRLVYLLTSNLPLSEVLASISKAEQGAAGDRLLTLHLGVRDNQNFDIPPTGYADTAAFAAHIEDGISKEYGTAMPAFVQALVDHRAKDEGQLRAGIDSRVEQFLDRVQADRMNGSAKRVAEAFGLVYVAGSLAKHYRVLPKSFDALEAARVSYHLFLASTERISYRNRVCGFRRSRACIPI